MCPAAADSALASAVATWHVAELDWRIPSQADALSPPFDVVLGADCVYNEYLVDHLLEVVERVTNHKSIGKGTGNPAGTEQKQGVLTSKQTAGAGKRHVVKCCAPPSAVNAIHSTSSLSKGFIQCKQLPPPPPAVVIANEVRSHSVHSYFLERFGERFNWKKVPAHKQVGGRGGEGVLC